MAFLNNFNRLLRIGAASGFGADPQAWTPIPAVDGVLYCHLSSLFRSKAVPEPAKALQVGVNRAGFAGGSTFSGVEASGKLGVVQY
jgi:hypothetical protein